MKKLCIHIFNWFKNPDENKLDAKDFDGTDLEDELYNERVRQIGREILFSLSQVNKK